LQLIGLWVIGGSGVDTERSPHFNYSHQLSRKSNHKFFRHTAKSTISRRIAIQFPTQHSAAAVVVGPPPSLWSHRRHRGAAIVVEPPLSSWSCRHCRGVTAVIVEPPSLLSRRHRRGAAAIFVEPPPLCFSHHCYHGAATVVVEPPLLS